MSSHRSRSSWDVWRRNLLRGAMHGALRCGRWLGPRGAIEAGRLLGAVSGLTGSLRQRLAANFRAAGVAATEERIDAYFRRFGDWAGWALAIYEHGLVASGVKDRITFDDVSLRHLDEAMALGRGVVLASPHFACHEILAACTGLRHPVAALVRESKSAPHDEVKRRWYGALGLEMVHRARHSSLVADTVALLRVLRGGRILGITPDVLMPEGKGVPVRLFGRTALLSPGFAVLAQRSGAPILTGSVRWDGPPGSRHARLHATFDKPIVLPKAGDRGRTTRDALQAWCDRLEAGLRPQPENWLFWMDKRWTRVLRTPPVAAA